MEIEKLKGEQLLTVQFYYNGEKLSTPLSLFRDEIAARAAEYQRESNGKITFEVDLSKVDITKDNIHLYYEFMDTPTKIKFSQTALNLKLHERSGEIAEKLNLTPGLLADHGHMSTTYYKTNGTPMPDILLDGKCLWWDNTSGTIGVSYFGVKDTLRPIEEYIAEIKQSQTYKEYLAEKSNKKSGLFNPAQIKSICDRYGVSTEELVDDKDHVIVSTHKDDIKAGDTILIGGIPTTVCKKDITKDSFMGTSIFGDSYKLGHQKIEKVLFKAELARETKSAIEQSPSHEVERILSEQTTKTTTPHQTQNL